MIWYKYEVRGLRIADFKYVLNFVSTDYKSAPSGGSQTSGSEFNIPDKKVSEFTNEDIRILKKALNNEEGFNIQTRKGKGK